ncbi:MAG: HAMP domain-containing sensor histidine kinase [Chloroflexota bacterium]
MNTSLTYNGGFALLCDLHGNLVQVIRDHLGIGSSLSVGMPLTRLAARGNLAKILSFMTEIKTRKTAYDWEINVALNEQQATTLHFTGEEIADQIIVVGAHSRKGSLQLYDQVLRLSNIKNETPQQPETRPGEDDLYNEVSWLNNELVSLQRELVKKNAELEHLNQEKNRFLGMAAHDLRNPLHVILFYSDFLLSEKQPVSVAQYREFLGVIRSSSQFMSQMVDNLLDVAVIEAGRLRLDYSPVDLGALVTDNVTLNQVVAGRKNIQINLIVDPLPPVMVDGAKITQVLNNLLGNAVKFSPAGACIDVQVSRDGENFLLAVRDQGPGIAPEEQARMFQPFQRGNARGTAGEKSTGLGLMIVKQIIQGHGGKIWLESQVGQGTTFFVKIPIYPPELQKLE